MLARLASTLKMPVSRKIFVAEGPRDFDLSARAEPDRDGVALAITSWTERQTRSSWLVAQPDPATPLVNALDWQWETDAKLMLTALTLSPDETGGLLPADVVGQPLTRLVRLIESDDGDLPILFGLAEGASFDDQRAVRRDRPDTEYVLAGTARTDAEGRLTGFNGTARVVPVGLGETPPDSLTVATAIDFTERLGQALRAPLDRIIARADTIGAQADGPLRRDYADYAGDIASAGRHLLALVEDLADLQAVEVPGFAIVGEPVDLADVARRAAGLLGVRASDKQVRIDRPDIDEALMAQGDFRRVLQILVNLLGNAVRYTPPGGMVWLRTERDADTAVVVVADQGKGIDPADHARVFDKFERIDPSEPGGSGLGLYISRRLARAMGGDITLDSAPGQGARFVLTLPVA
jgi:signal transduction histidine kinase